MGGPFIHLKQQEKHTCGTHGAHAQRYLALPRHADGQRLIVFMVERRTPDHDAMLLLDQAGQDAQTPVLPGAAGMLPQRLAA